MRFKAGLLVTAAAIAGLVVSATPAAASSSYAGAPEFQSFSVIELRGPSTEATPATPLDYYRGDTTATPLGDGEPLVLRKTIDLSQSYATPFTARPPDYPSTPVYCTSQFHRPGCLQVPTVDFKVREARCVDPTRLELKIVATNTNRYGLVRGWAPVELEVVTNGSPFGDAALVPPATYKGNGMFEWTYYLPNGRTTIDAGFAPQPALDFGGIVLGISCDSPRS